jgi:hypothetical protein
MSWDRIKHYFFADGKSRSHYSHFNTEKIMELGLEMGLTKQQIYNYLQNIVILNNLGDDENA